jgi:catechol 2,3-dioxygenase-like lactoylglutathione lyase family enzyme
MPVASLQHVNIRCADAKASRDFYVELIGLAEGRRPPFPSQGYWLYLGDVPVVHLVQKRESEPKRGPGTGELDHVAFEGVDLEATRRLLTERGQSFREAVVPRDGTVQIFVSDPDGVMLELNFAMP